MAKKQQNTSTVTHESKPLKKAAIENAPPLEVNFESGAEFIRDESDDISNKYSGVVNENLESDSDYKSGSRDVKDTTLPDVEANLFNKVSKKKFT